MFHVHTPTPTRGRSKFLDVEFVDGVAHLDTLHPVRAQALTQHGYRVVRQFELDELNVFELRKMATGLGVDVPARAKKPELVAALHDAYTRGR